MPGIRNMAVWVHAIIWLCLFFYPFLFHYVSVTDARAVTRIFLLLLLTMLFFYGNMFFLIPKLLASKKIVLYFVCVIAGIGVVALGWGFLEKLMNPNYAHSSPAYDVGITAGIAISFLAWVTSSGIKITQEWFRNEQQRKTAEHEKVNAELAFLKWQVNPHFLFNALNNIYALEQKKSPDTGDAILRLSELIRYMLYEAASDKIPLEKEVEYLQSYVELQKLGMSSAVQVQFDVQGDYSGKTIEPMLLIPLVENTFKHGVSYQAGVPVTIRLEVKNDSLDLWTENGIYPRPRTKDKTNGIGIVNLRKRLELLYPNKYLLETNPTAEKYFTHLKIALQ